MKQITLLFAFLLITGISFGQFPGIPFDDGTPSDTEIGAAKAEPNSNRGMMSLPEYYNYNTTGSANSFPWGLPNGSKVQLLYLSGDFNQPTPAPAGDITSISFRTHDNWPLGPATYTDLIIKMGQSSITSFTPGSWYPGSLTTVYYRASVTLSSLAGEWMTIYLDTPFSYDPTQSLILDVSQCNINPNTLFFPSCRTSMPVGTRRMFSAPGGCPFNYGNADSNVYHIGIGFEQPAPVPVSNWALIIGAGLILAFAVVRFRNIF